MSTCGRFLLIPRRIVHHIGTFVTAFRGSKEFVLPTSFAPWNPTMWPDRRPHHRRLVEVLYSCARVSQSS